MTTDPAALSEPLAAPSPPPSRPITALLVAEDWILAVWVAVATPFLFRAQGGGGPFDSGAPLLGTLRLAAVLAALICIAARRTRQEVTQSGPSLIQRGAVGPLTGALLLVTISGFTALDLGSGVGVWLLLVAAIAMIVVHFAVPPLGAPARRILVTPLVLVAGGLFWTFIAAISGEPGSATPAAGLADPQTTVAAAAFLVAFSAVYYTMLVYAPRQIAERQGGLLTWVLRYVLFVAGVVVGLAWPRLFGT